MALQAKMLRFLECGELQRVGDNETMRVDVRVIAATHQPLEKLAMSVGAERTFRLDLYYWLQDLAGERGFRQGGEFTGDERRREGLRLCCSSRVGLRESLVPRKKRADEALFFLAKLNCLFWQ